MPCKLLLVDCNFSIASYQSTALLMTASSWLVTAFNLFSLLFAINSVPVAK
jgi:hypothetical protein